MSLVDFGLECNPIPTNKVSSPHFLLLLPLGRHLLTYSLSAIGLLHFLVHTVAVSVGWLKKARSKECLTPLQSSPWSVCEEHTSSARIR